MQIVVTLESDLVWYLVNTETSNLQDASTWTEIVRMPQTQYVDVKFAWADPYAAQPYGVLMADQDLIYFYFDE